VVFMALIKNKEYDALICGYTAEGAGVARIDGQVVFIPGALDGETVRVKIIKVTKNLCYGKVVQVISASEDRIAPECPVFPKCGGCDLWHMSRREEKRFKQERVREVLMRVGGFENPPIQPIIAEEERGRYRNKCMFPVGPSADGGMRSGFYRSHSHDIVETPDCRIQQVRANEMRAFAVRIACELGIAPYDESDGSGVLRNLYFRCGDAQDMLCIIAAKKAPQLKDLARRMADEFPHLKSVSISVNPTRGNVLMGKTVEPVIGDLFWQAEMCGFSFCISPQAFYQVNRAQAERLYAKAVEYAALDAGSFALDLYCGAGTITLNLAKVAGRVLGVEVVPQAVDNARENAQINGVSNVEFICADASQAAAELARRGERPDVIVVDPPRKGMDAAGVDAMLKMSPDRIVYVSCDPATLARDLKLLTAGGYTLREVTPVDMFPATRHVECVVCLSREKADDYIRISVHTDDLKAKAN